MKKGFLLLIAVCGPALAQQPSPAEQRIVVTGARLSDTARRLEECIKRGCPPDEDIDATLVHVENQFLNGDYKGARRTASASIRRNSRHAKAYAVPLSELFRANARVAVHLGEGRTFENSTLEIRRSLKAGLPDDDPRIIVAELEVAGMKAALDRADSALLSYEEIEKKARHIQRPDLAATARVRRAWLLHQAGYSSSARPILEELAADTDPLVRIPRLTALLLLARIDRAAGKLARSEALLDEVNKIGFAKPVLLYSPPVELGNRPSLQRGESGSVTHLLATDTFDDKWADIGFWVNPNGRVAEVEILRSSGETDWVKPVLKSISGRIYSALPGGSGEPGSYRIERYSYTSLWEPRTGTRLRQRSAQTRVESLDLTDETAD